MRKSVSRSKTNKAVAKRFKVTKGGKGKKVLASQSGRRHLAASKSRKRKRQLAMQKLADGSDLKRIRKNLPFS